MHYNRKHQRWWAPTRHQAVYIPLPFDLAPIVARRDRVVIPGRNGTDDQQRADVFLRFHRATEVPRVLDERAIEVAVSRARRPETALRHLETALNVLSERMKVPQRHPVCVAELVTAFPAGPVDQAASQELLEYCLRALNRWLDRHVVVTEQPDVCALNWENLPAEVVIELRRHSDQPTGRLKMPLKSKQLPHEAPEPPEGLWALGERHLRAERNPHPLDLVRRLHARASRLADRGDYELAIDTLQVSAERLVFAMHTFVLIEQGHTSSEIEDLLPRYFKPALTGLAQSVGGNWSIAGDGSVARYWRDLYEVRNRIVHAGITPERDAVPNAFEAYDALWQHIHDRALAKRASLPRTALCVHGGIGLNEAGALDVRMRRFVSDIEAAGEDYTYWLPIDRRQAMTTDVGHDSLSNRGD